MSALAPPFLTLGPKSRDGTSRPASAEPCYSMSTVQEATQRHLLPVPFIYTGMEDPGRRCGSGAVPVDSVPAFLSSVQAGFTPAGVPRWPHDFRRPHHFLPVHPPTPARQIQPHKDASKETGLPCSPCFNIGGNEKQATPCYERPAYCRHTTIMDGLI